MTSMFLGVEIDLFVAVGIDYIPRGSVFETRRNRLEL